MKKQYLFSHLMGFIEGKVVDGTATPEEEHLYQDYKWYGKIKKQSFTYRSLVNQYLNSEY
ncbi:MULTISPECIES: hypothetical protein [Bacillus]|uniref:hypothetical protein n=1 Tax=Bacillus TaxID=1386 RepID=UPI0006ADEB85|nr:MULTISPECIES: hypothetical protein [Bacillus]AWD88021.1 hypothetical protein BVQ_11350 [Bacillus velezensis]KAF6690596.1 hypothetical protein G9362_16255 [Bacillus sp. EKM601B]KOS49161.1 hypothetical protein AN272_19660 [Bacillus amyloliquefaciens]MBA9149825.1 hypothetical protein [Bacillus sp. EKM213B]MBT9285929.1 hypothetical protein [Bacillus velezensis]